MEYRPPASRDYRKRPMSSIPKQKPKIPTRPQTAHDLRRRMPSNGRNLLGKGRSSATRPKSSCSTRKTRPMNSKWNRLRESHVFSIKKKHPSNMCGMYNILSPLNPKLEGVGVKCRIADTIFLSENNTFVSWFTNDRKGLIRKRPSSSLTTRNIMSKFAILKQRRQDFHDGLCVLRRENGCEVVSEGGLEAFCKHRISSSEMTPSMDEDQTASEALDLLEDGKYIAIQEFIPAHNDTRYLVVFLNDSSTAKAACETFALTYSNNTTDISEKTMNMERMVGQIPVPKPRVIPLKDAKVSEGLRRLTLQVANYINRTTLNTTLEGLVCEFVIDANAISKRQNVIPSTRLIDHAVLIGVLGYKFRGNIPTWVEEQGKNRNADLLCTLVPRIDVAKPISNFKTLANPATNVEGSVVRKVTHRISGPAVVSQMAEELEHYQNTLGSKLQEAAEAQNELDKVNLDLDESKTKLENLREQLLETTKEHNRTVGDARRLTQLLSKTQSENKKLKDSVTKSSQEAAGLKEQLLAERETAFKVMGSMQKKIDNLEDLKERHEIEISGLQTANQRAAEQNQEQHQIIIALRKQLVEYSKNLSNTAEVLKQTRDVLDNTRKERDHYRRSLPFGGKDEAVERRTPPYKLHLQDIIDNHEKPESEMYMLNNYLHGKKDLFEKIFLRYVSASHDDQERLIHDHGFHTFLKNCHIVSNKFSVAEADILMQHAHSRGGNRHGQYNHKYNSRDFVEAIIRMANHMFKDEEGYLTESVRRFCTEKLEPYFKKNVQNADKHD